ncbi:putative F-box/LRR-repeat protein At4g15060 [Chenopodium quinoa]|uniref:putative F-box/LRR-repeat protein At4g15060 n=1 Tax=Chenopodium quinoa TaxID=63459 RepID=UPI000B78B908|nr:putative F-box/LRR-repeat protein At4g15060 [Chenopodium quinoa]XP_021737420.1 putative F-box/LRR-repeat protein At4g15060 [Chenopodium quinoa]
MVERTWPALQSCKHQCSEANDLLSQLPDDLLFFIMSFLTLKEAARTSVLSHRWNYLWRCLPVLIFEDFSAMERMFKDDDFVSQERSSFLRWVNRVVEAHLGKYVDELRVTFDFNKRCQSDINKWLVFAVAKHVKRLELNFTTPTGCYKSSLPRWRMSLDQPHNLSVFKSSLRSLSLTYVYVTTNDIDCLLSSCMVLENLCINNSRPLKYIRAFGLPLQLKHLEVSYCPRLRTIDILAPKLLSFTHHGNPVELHIRNASLLSKLSLGNIRCTRDIVACAFDSLSKYFSQLEYLSWTIGLCIGSSISLTFCVKFNLGIKNPPAMTNLKHLELHVTAFCEQSLLGWADLIEASPLLERLTLKFSAYHGKHSRKIIK